jgi:hypothetical protein
MMSDAEIKLFADYTNFFILSDRIELLNQKAQRCIVQQHHWLLLTD